MECLLRLIPRQVGGKLAVKMGSTLAHGFRRVGMVRRQSGRRARISSRGCSIACSRQMHLAMTTKETNRKTELVRNEVKKTPPDLGRRFLFEQRNCGFYH